MRTPHKVAHPVCPHANWAKCDLAEKVRFGQCKAMVGDKKSEPEPCSRWAVSEAGWCWQHYESETDRVKREEKEAARKLQLRQAIDDYLAWTSEHPSIFDIPPGSKPLPSTGGRTIPSVVLKETPPVPKREGGEELVRQPPIRRYRPW